jgi:hypothetical protein
LRPVNQLDQCHRCRIALAESKFKDPQIPAWSRLVARPELVEQLDDDVAIAQSIEREAAVCDRRILAQCDQRLGNAAQFLRFGQRRPNRFVREERVSHVAQHRKAMRARTVQLSQAMAMTHVFSLVLLA